MHQLILEPWIGLGMSIYFQGICPGNEKKFICFMFQTTLTEQCTGLYALISQHAVAPFSSSLCSPEGLGKGLVQ